jgi:general stress protein 26
MMTTVQAGGLLRSRPMATQKTPFDGELWFFTGHHSPKVDEIQADSHVNLSYSDPDSRHHVSITGTAELVQDREKIRSLWTPALQAWFPEGPDDPEVALLRVSVDSAEYWDAPSSKMVHLYDRVKAALTGKPVKDPGDHQKIGKNQAA